MQAYGGYGFGKKTIAFGTRIQRLVPPKVGGILRITNLVYTAAGTAHLLTLARPIGRTTLSAAAAGAQAVVNLTADPGAAISNAIAANDYVAVRETDNVTRFYKVSSVSTLAITLTANLVTGAAAGAKFWFFGILTDTDPVTGEAHPTFDGTASVTSTYTDREVGVVATLQADDPILFDSDNGTATGILAQLSFGYTKS